MFFKSIIFDEKLMNKSFLEELVENIASICIKLVHEVTFIDHITLR